MNARTAIVGAERYIKLESSVPGTGPHDITKDVVDKILDEAGSTDSSLVGPLTKVLSEYIGVLQSRDLEISAKTKMNEFLTSEVRRLTLENLILKLVAREFDYTNNVVHSHLGWSGGGSHE